MTYYYKLGEIPAKKHTTFYKSDGKSLYREELMSSRGFSDRYSTKYHIHMPTAFVGRKELSAQPLEQWTDGPIGHYHFYTDKVKSEGNYITARKPYLFNSTTVLSTAHVTENTDNFFRNAYHHEIIFIHRGTGTFYSEFGRLPFEYGDQIVVPKSTIYRMEFDQLDDNKLFITESTTPFDIPNHYKNPYGQMEEHAPYCERDFKVPEYLEPVDEEGEFPIVIKMGERYFNYTMDHHPLDVVGWDGCLYPFIFNMKDFAPKVGKLHLPPPVHLVFITQGFVYCNFCPRLYDFHEDAVPAPYFHHNIDSEEVLYYVEGNFMSRKGIEEGSITLHPMGVPHGPQPGKTEASIGKKETHEYALMVDTFAPLHMTAHVSESMDPEYHRSWIETPV